MMYKNCDYYRGQWVNGQKQERGLQIYNEKGYICEGQWKCNLVNGQGKISNWNGSTYVGEFKDNIRYGKGQFYDIQNKNVIDQLQQNGVLIKQKIKEGAMSKDEEFPTLVLDKQRFNSQDLQNFQKENPEIKELEISFLIKYYNICKIIKLTFIQMSIKEQDYKQVRQFIDFTNLSKYRETFYKNKILGKSLVTITQKQMKEYFRMKLGDRRRLSNFCKYLSEIHEEKKKKEYRKANVLRKLAPDGRKPHSMHDSHKSPKFKTAYTNKGDIIKEKV